MTFFVYLDRFIYTLGFGHIMGETFSPSLSLVKIKQTQMRFHKVIAMEHLRDNVNNFNSCLYVFAMERATAVVAGLGRHLLCQNI